MQELKPNLKLASNDWDIFDVRPFLVQLESSLSPAFKVSRADLSLYSVEQIIVIAFGFSASLIATGFFQKLGADIYDGMKGALEGLWTKLRDKARHEVGKPMLVEFWFEIEQEDGTSVNGSFVSDNWDLLQEAISKLDRLQEAFERARQTEQKRVFSFTFEPLEGEWERLE